MPKNKEALIRYRVINKCLLDRKYITKRELKEACERALDIYPIGERTIDADINSMRYDERLGYLAPIKMDKIRRAYYYDDPDYSIDKIPLNEDELESVVFASKLLEQFKGVEIFEKFTGSVQKLVSAVNIYRLNEDSVSRDFIEFERVDEAKGTEYLKPLIDALKNREVVKIEYRAFSASKNTVNFIHPYLLKEYRTRWYLIGYNAKYSEVRTYSLDRFVNMEADPSMEYIDTGFDAKKYYENVVGISVLSMDPIEIRIAFSENQAQYVITRPLHSSQELVENGNKGYVFKYFLVPTFEFFSQILGWGDEVEILKPQSLRKQMQSLLRKMVQIYSR